MRRNANEKVVHIGSSHDDDYYPSNMSRQRKRRRSNCFSNFLTIIALIGLVVGGGILGTTLWDEYNRVQMTKEFTQEATELVQNRISRSDFSAEEGHVVGLIKLPDQDNLTVPIVEGVEEEDLHAGIGHYTNTGWPSDQRQVFLAGHRNTEFGALQYVKVGERVIVEMPYGTFTYKIIPVPQDGIQSDLVHAGRYVHETQMEVVNTEPKGEFPKDQLVLMTCYPFTFGASLEHRFLLYGERVEL